MLMKGVIMLHDNACPHMACTVQDTEKCWAILTQP
jgi:hypothetical protein